MVMELRRVLPYINNHREIIVQLGYYSGHIANPFSPLFYPHRSEYPAFHMMWPRINNQNLWMPCGLSRRVWKNSKSQFLRRIPNQH